MRRALMLARGPPTVAALLSRSPRQIECIRVKGSLPSANERRSGPDSKIHGMAGANLPQPLRRSPQSAAFCPLRCPPTPCQAAAWHQGGKNDVTLGPPVPETARSSRQAWLCGASHDPGMSERPHHGDGRPGLRQTY